MDIESIIEKWQIPQNWQSYNADEHAIWRELYEKQNSLLKDIACEEFWEGIEHLNLNNGGIPDISLLNKSLQQQNGWKIIAVKGLIPDFDFFALLANRIFPVGQFIRKREQFEYISEPDIFHDIFGHVPLLTNPIFADYMQAYGIGGLRATEFNCLDQLARLYWYTVEFGLKVENGKIKAYGAGILSSPQESQYSIFDPKPKRIKFELNRLMRTKYYIDKLQSTYFVINDFEQLFNATLQDFAPIYKKIKSLKTIEAGTIIENDRLI